MQIGPCVPVRTWEYCYKRLKLAQLPGQLSWRLSHLVNVARHDRFDIHSERREHPRQRLDVPSVEETLPLQEPGAADVEHRRVVAEHQRRRTLGVDGEGISARPCIFSIRNH